MSESSGNDEVTLVNTVDVVENVNSPIGPTGPAKLTDSNMNLLKINNLVSTVESIVVPKLHLDKYLSFVNDPDVKQIVNILTNNSESIQDIVSMVNLIFSNTTGKVNISDAPLLLGLIKKIISVRTKNIKLSQDLSLTQFLDIIKLIFTILAKEGILNITNADDFLNDTNELINLIKIEQQVMSTMQSCCGSFFSRK